MKMLDGCAAVSEDSGAFFIRIVHQIKFGKYLLQFIAESFAVSFPLQNTRKSLFFRQQNMQNLNVTVTTRRRTLPQNGVLIRSDFRRL
jgi:hypothetical protein